MYLLDKTYAIWLHRITVDGPYPLDLIHLIVPNVHEPSFYSIFSEILMVVNKDGRSFQCSVKCSSYAYTVKPMTFDKV